MSDLGLRIPKSNWANTIDEPPFEAYAAAYEDVLMIAIVSDEPDAAILDSCERLNRLDWRSSAMRLAS